MTSPIESPPSDEKSKQVEEKSKEMETKEYQSYPFRWLILSLFVLYSSSNAFQWTQLVIITSILEKYYNVKQCLLMLSSIIHGNNRY